MLISFLTLSGCIQSNSLTKVNEDGSGIVYLEIKTDEYLIRTLQGYMGLPEISSEALTADISIIEPLINDPSINIKATPVTDGEVGLVLSTEFQSAEDLQGAIESVLSAGLVFADGLDLTHDQLIQDVSLVIKNETNYTFTATVSDSSLGMDNINEGIAAAEAETDLAPKMLFTISMPGEVIETNGKTINKLDIGGTTVYNAVQWDIRNKIQEGGGPITLTTSTATRANWFIVGIIVISVILLIGLIATVVFFVIKKRGNSAQGQHGYSVQPQPHMPVQPQPHIPVNPQPHMQTIGVIINTHPNIDGLLVLTNTTKTEFVLSNGQVISRANVEQLYTSGKLKTTQTNT